MSICYSGVMSLHYFCSTTADGTMRSINADYTSAQNNRAAFVKKCGINPASVTLHTLSYGGKDYCRYKLLNDKQLGDGIVRDSTIDADAVVVTQHHHGILLPLADCVGAVIYEPMMNILMVSHLGRHNLEQFGGAKCIQYLIDTFKIDASRLTVQLSPSASSNNYPLFAFNNRSLQEVAIEQLLDAGVKLANITPSPIDTTVDTNLFSHSEFLKGNRNSDGRFAIVATLY